VTALHSISRRCRRLHRGMLLTPTAKSGCKTRPDRFPPWHVMPVCLIDANVSLRWSVHEKSPLPSLSKHDMSHFHNKRISGYHDFELAFSLVPERQRCEPDVCLSSGICETSLSRSMLQCVNPKIGGNSSHPCTAHSSNFLERVREMKTMLDRAAERRLHHRTRNA
jgi:hypothetical protein